MYSRGGEVVVPASGETAEDISIASVVEKSGVLLGGDLNIITPHDDLDSAFLAISISNGKPHNDMAKMAQGKSVVHLHNTDLEKIDLVYPSHNEQAQISTCFKRIDNLITLHQCKQYCPRTSDSISKFDMVPAHNTVTWEQRKFSDLYERIGEKNDLTYGKEDIISVANMYFKPDSYITDPEYLKTYNVFHLGDIAFEGNKSKNFAHGRFVENTIGNGIVSHVFDVFRPKTDYDLHFWKYAINNERIMGEILVRCTKASTMMTNLVANDFLQESILVPDVAEQQKIGAYLEQLDNLITLHQCKYYCHRTGALTANSSRPRHIIQLLGNSVSFLNLH